MSLNHRVKRFNETQVYILKDLDHRIKKQSNKEIVTKKRDKYGNKKNDR